MSANGRANPRDFDSQPTRESLLSGARRRDPESWNRLCRLYEPLATHWCRRLGVPSQDVPDVVQDVFSSVARGLDKFHKRGSGDSFRAWLRTVTHNRAMDWFRANAGKATAAGGSIAWKRMSELPADEGGNAARSSDSECATDAASLHQALLNEALQTVQSNCDDQTWRAFWRVVVDGVRAVDVAEELGVSAVSVRVAKCRVLNRLRRELGDVEF